MESFLVNYFDVAVAYAAAKEFAGAPPYSNLSSSKPNSSQVRRM
jgi:hypothetical protein